MLPCRASGVYIGAWPPPSSGSPPCLLSASLGLVWGRNCNRNTQRMCSGEYLLTGPEHSMLFCRWCDAGYRKELSDRQWLSSSPHEGGIWVSFALCTHRGKDKTQSPPPPPLLGCRHFSCEVVLLTGDVSNTSPAALGGPDAKICVRCHDGTWCCSRDSSSLFLIPWTEKGRFQLLSYFIFVT